MKDFSQHVQERYDQKKPDKSIYTVFEKLNVLEQVKNLMSHRFIQEAVKENELNIIAAYYDIKTGHVLINEPSTKSLLAHTKKATRCDT